MKICKKCKIDKELEEFSLHKNFKDGRNSTCRQCKNDEAKRYYRENVKNDEQRMEAGRQQRRHKWRQDRYGVTKQQYDSMYAEQNGKCFLCDTRYETLCQDHCHKTNVNRKLLCHSCNVGLGFFKDDIETLTKAIDYLKEFIMPDSLSGKASAL